MGEAARPGWYQDPEGEEGILRWWDGEGWTEHRQPRPDRGIAEGAPAGRFEALRESFSDRPRALAIGAAVALCAVAIALASLLGSSGDPFSPGSEGSGGIGGSSSGRQPALDRSPQELARAAQTAIEIYATGNGGSYAGASPEDLAEIETSLTASQVAVSSNETAYTVTAISGEVAFSISRAADGEVTLSCEPPGVLNCPRDGDWS